MTIRNRIKELRRVPANQLRPNPKNWRVHPTSQQNALREVLAEVGMASACIARELEDGTLVLLDGHMRAETIQDNEVPVLVLDVTEEEGDTILATFDPIVSMAKTDKEAFAALAKTEEKVEERLEALNEEDARDEIREDDEDDEEEVAEIRMVQLFFDPQTVEEFNENWNKLAIHYETNGLTDTVLEALKREAAK